MVCGAGPYGGGFFLSTYISNRELEELGEGLTRHYLENAHIHMAARCRFTIAHEIAHSVIEKHNPVPQFHRIYDSEHGYTFQELKAQLTMTENQADQLAAVILMPQFTVDQALRDFNKGRRIKVYGKNVYANEERRIISRMAAQVGVFFSAMQIRLRELGFLEYHPLDEYVEKNLLGGEG